MMEKYSNYQVKVLKISKSTNRMSISLGFLHKEGSNFAAFLKQTAILRRWQNSSSTFYAK
jgi:hypothetical protein